MAFIAGLPKQPKRNMYLQEGHYGSRLQLRVNPSNNCCDGTYEPLVHDDGDEPNKNASGPGHAVLFGHLEPEPDSEIFTLRGEWRHLTGLRKSGSFEMKVDREGSGNGWWSKGDGSESVPWQWSPNASGIGLFGQEFGIAKDDDGGQHVIQSAPTERRLRSSMSSRSDRGKSFFDELLGSEGSSATMIARWGVFCAWIFFWQTLCALLLSSIQVSGTAVSIVQCGFQAVYTITYASFLVIYSRMHVLPPLDYVAGVVLYTFGYACFFALYAVILATEGDEDAAPFTQVLYVIGSFLFLTGSAVLVKATLPPLVPMATRKMSLMEEVRGRFSLLDQQSSLFWGSVTFLLGSILFFLDSSWGLFHAASKPELLGVVSVSMGYAFFTVGRVYFLWGSTTSECDAFMRGGGWGYKWCDTLSQPLKIFCLFRTKSVKSVSVNLDDMLNVVGTTRGFKVQPTPEAESEP